MSDSDDGDVTYQPLSEDYSYTSENDPSSEEEENDDDLYAPSTSRKRSKCGKSSKKKKPANPAKLAPIFQKPTNATDTIRSPDSHSTSEGDTDNPAKPQEEDSNQLKQKNPLWNYFDKTTISEAKCKTCSKTLKTGSSGTTSSLLKHLGLHKSIFEKYTKEKDQFKDSSKKTPQIPNPAPQQQKVSEMMSRTTKWPSGSTEEKKTNKLVANFIVGGLHPYSVVEEDGFKDLMEAGFPKYNMPTRTTFSRSIIPEQFTVEQNKLKSEISNDLPYVQSLSFTTDGWKSRGGHAYLSLTSHYVDKDFNYKKFTLANRAFYERQTGDNIVKFLKQEMANWGIPTENRTIPIFVVTDGGKNMVNAIKQSPWSHRECFAHKLQLVVEGAINIDQQAKEMLQKARTIVGHYHKSAAATARLSTIQKQLNMSPLNVIQMVETRWNSELFMLERLVRLKTAISTELATSQHTITNLTTEEWELAAGYIEALKPIELHTNVMSGDTYPTSSMIIPVLNEIESTLNQIIDTDPTKTKNPKTINFARNLLNQLRVRFVQYKSETFNQIATTVDPRFKCVLLERSLVEKKLINLIEQNQDRNVTNPTGTTTLFNEPSTSASSTKKPNLWAAFQSAAAKSQQVTTYSPATKEVKRYLDDPVVAPTVNPYTFWKSEQFSYPLLYKVASYYLPIPATQTSSERLFSTAGNIVTARRESLLPEHAEQLLFLENVFKKDRESRKKK